MKNFQIVSFVEDLRDIREDWVAGATKRDSVNAAQHILSINTKIELLLSMWNWSDETVDFPY